VYVVDLFCRFFTESQFLVLNPKEKMAHFRKHWSEDIQQDVLDCAEDVVCVLLYFGSVCSKHRLYQFQQRYEELHKSGPRPSVKKNKKPGIKKLLRELSDDEDDPNTTPVPSDDSDKPWRPEFSRYLNADHELSEGMTSIKWWGVSSLNFNKTFSAY
jgi:hypothetical protein